MTPEYLEELAQRADPNQLWRLSGIEQRDNLSPSQRVQLDTAVALRRYASHLQELRVAQVAKKSVLITPLSPNSSARKMIDTPADHAKLRVVPR